MFRPRVERQLSSDLSMVLFTASVLALLSHKVAGLLGSSLQQRLPLLESDHQADPPHIDCDLNPLTGTDGKGMISAGGRRSVSLPQDRIPAKVLLNGQGEISAGGRRSIFLSQDKIPAEALRLSGQDCETAILRPRAAVLWNAYGSMEVSVIVALST
jgi:hypothetical protein